MVELIGDLNGLAERKISGRTMSSRPDAMMRAPWTVQGLFRELR